MIRKMRPFEEPHAPPDGSATRTADKRRAGVASVKGYGGLFSKAAQDEVVWNTNEALDFTIGQPLKGLFVVAIVVNISTGRLFAGMGAFDSFGRSLNAIFEKRSPWHTLRVDILYCLSVCATMERSGNPRLITAQKPVGKPVPQ